MFVFSALFTPKISSVSMVNSWRHSWEYFSLQQLFSVAQRLQTRKTYTIPAKLCKSVLVLLTNNSTMTCLLARRDMLLSCWLTSFSPGLSPLSSVRQKIIYVETSFFQSSLIASSVKVHFALCCKLAIIFVCLDKTYCFCRKFSIFSRSSFSLVLAPAKVVVINRVDCPEVSLLVRWTTHFDKAIIQR